MKTGDLLRESPQLASWRPRPADERQVLLSILDGPALAGRPRRP